MHYWRSFYKTHEHYNLLVKTKWNYLQKIIKGPAPLSVAHDRNVCAKHLIKLRGSWLNSDIFRRSKYQLFHSSMDSVTKFTATFAIIHSVTPKAVAKHELLPNKPVSGFFFFASDKQPSLFHHTPGDEEKEWGYKIDTLTAFRQNRVALRCSWRKIQKTFFKVTHKFEES